MNEPTVASLLAAGTAQLASGAEWVREDAASEAEYLLAAVLGWNRTQLRLRLETAVTVAAVTQYKAHLARRAAGEPVAYLLGEREFWSLPLQVGPGVLVPRPDTECLVEVALRFLQKQTAVREKATDLPTPSTFSPTPSVLDLGTGSGAIALALATELPLAQVVAVELSPAALAVAAGNIARLAPGRVELLAGHWYEPVGGRRFACIVSNPPYLAEDDPHLPSLVAEPRTALVSGADGLECYREIVAGAPKHLETGGLLAVEHGHTQGAAVSALFAAAGFTSIATHRDLAGLERVTSGVRTGTFSQNRFRFDPGLPFGGFKQSGLGREGGREGLASFTEFKSVLLDT